MYFYCAARCRTWRSAWRGSWRLGFSEEWAAILLPLFPPLWDVDVTQMHQVFTLLEERGFGGNALKKLVSEHSYLLLEDREVIERRLNELLDVGIEQLQIVSIFTAHPLLFGFSLGRDTIHTIRELQGKHFGTKWITSALLHCLGDYDQALALLGAAKRHFGVHPRMPYKLICCCVEELGLARALRVRDVAAARLHRSNIATYHQHRAMYASALVAMAEGSYHTALLETQRALDAQRSSLQHTDLCLQLEARCHLLLAEVYSRKGLPVMGLPHALEGVAFCQDHHLGNIEYETKLALAHIQLQLCSVDQCLLLLEKL